MPITPPEKDDLLRVLNKILEAIKAINIDCPDVIVGGGGSDTPIEDLDTAPVLVTDLIAHQPISGPPSKKGTVTAVFTDASGNLAIDRDNRQLTDPTGAKAYDWAQRLQYDSSGAESINSQGRFLLDASGNDSVDWVNHQLLLGAGGPTVDWASLILYDNSGVQEIVNWSTKVLKRGDGTPSVNWSDNLLTANDGTTVVLDFSSQQSSSGPQTAGAIFTSTEQTMLQEAYDALRAYGLLS